MASTVWTLIIWIWLVSLSQPGMAFTVWPLIIWIWLVSPFSAWHGFHCVDTYNLDMASQSVLSLASTVWTLIIWIWWRYILPLISLSSRFLSTVTSLLASNNLVPFCVIDRHLICESISHLSNQYSQGRKLSNNVTISKWFTQIQSDEAVSTCLPVGCVPLPPQFRF